MKAFFKHKVILFTIFFTLTHISASNIIGVEVATGKLTIDSNKRDIDSFGMFIGEKDDEDKVTFGFFYKHIGTNKVADFLGVELSKGISISSFDSPSFEIYPYGKVGAGISVVDLFSKSEDEEDKYISEVQKTNDLRYKQKKVFVSTGVGLNLSLKRSFDIYIEQNLIFLFPMRDNISLSTLGIVYKF